MKRTALSLLFLCGCTPVDPALCVVSREPRLQWTTFHGSALRTGWNDREFMLTPSVVGSDRFGERWRSEPFAPFRAEGMNFAAHVYASPLYLDEVQLTAGPFAGRRTSVVFIATSNADVYALNAFEDGCGLRPGTVLWRSHLNEPAIAPKMDGGLPVGVLSTPVIDASANPPVLYVASMDATAGWQLFALSTSSGNVLPGWPVTMNGQTVEPVNRNGPARWLDPRTLSQRGALNLSRDGAFVYVSFGSYFAQSVGWMVAVGTNPPRVAHAFSSAPENEARSNGGMWGAGGPAVDERGRVYMTTGNGPPEHTGLASHWSSSLLQWDATLGLLGAYTPFSYCVLDRYNMDLSGSSPMLLPETIAQRSLLSFGGKQGIVYLLDREQLSMGLTGRNECSTDASRDRSLLSPNVQPMWNSRGPLLVFGPYTERDAQLDTARMRSTPTYFRASDGSVRLYVSGSPKAEESSPRSVAPGLVRLVLQSTADSAHLAVDAMANSLVLQNPGAPVVTSAGSQHPVVWILDSNQLRTVPLIGPSARGGILYAVDGESMRVLWQSAEGLLEPGGKYNEPLIAHGTVFVATDRLHAFRAVP